MVYSPSAIFLKITTRCITLAKKWSAFVRLGGNTEVELSRTLASLFLGEIDTYVIDRLDKVGPIQLAYQYFNSKNFAIDVAEPLLDGSYLRPRETVGIDTARFIENIFGLKPEAADFRLILLARLLESERFQSLQTLNETPWSGRDIALACRRCVGIPNPDGSYPHLQYITQNIEIYTVNGISQDGDWNSVTFTSDDPNVMFRIPLKDCINSGICRLNFGVITSEAQPTPSLHLNYGEGYFPLAITPRGRSMYSAYIATAGLIGVKWKLGSALAKAVITVLTAGLTTRQELIDSVLTNSGWTGHQRLELLFEHMDSGDFFPAAAINASRAMTKSVGGHVETQRNYNSWIRSWEFFGHERQSLAAARLRDLSSRPTISILAVLINMGLDQFEIFLNSMYAQIYPHWELEIGVAKGGALHEDMKIFNHLDPRVRVTWSDSDVQSNIANEIMAHVENDWIICVSGEVILSDLALLSFAEVISQRGEVELIYSDEDEIDETGVRSRPWFKTDYSPALFWAQNYMKNLVAYKADRVRRAGGWRSEYSGAIDYDMTLRVLEQIQHRHVFHIQSILYHVPRKLDTSSRLVMEELEISSSYNSLVEFFERKGTGEKVLLLPGGGRRVKIRRLGRNPLVSIIIPTKDKVEVLKLCIDSILNRTSYSSYEIIIVDNGSIEPSTAAYLNELSTDARITVLRHDRKFNYSELNNIGSRNAKGSILAFLNNDVEVISSDWIEEMSSWASLSDVGCVGAKLLYSDGMIQHAGVILGIGGIAAHSHKYFEKDDHGYFDRLIHHQDYSAVTGACLFIQKALFDKLGGFDESLAIAYNDVDLCLRSNRLGCRTIFTPYAQLYHHESLSRGVDDTPEKWSRLKYEVGFMQSRWGSDLLRDPFYSPNLTLETEDFNLRWMSE